MADDRPSYAAPPEPTGVCRPDIATRFRPGQSGNPAGRKPGARNKLGEAFLEAVRADFDQHGHAAIVAMRETDPGAYIRTIASLMPKELLIEQTSDRVADDPEARDREIERLVAKAGYIRDPSRTSGRA